MNLRWGDAYENIPRARRNTLALAGLGRTRAVEIRHGHCSVSIHVAEIWELGEAVNTFHLYFPLP